MPLPPDAAGPAVAGPVPLTVPRPEPAPARDYVWCGATRVNVPQLLGGAEVDIPLQVRRCTGCRSNINSSTEADWRSSRLTAPTLMSTASHSSAV